MGDTGYRFYHYFSCTNCSLDVHLNEEHLDGLPLQGLEFSCLFDACDGTLEYSHRESGILNEVPQD